MTQDYLNLLEDGIVAIDNEVDARSILRLLDVNNIQYAILGVPSEKERHEGIVITLKRKNGKHL